MQRNIKILFVCHGNICRSPMCEFILKDLAVKSGYRVAGVGGASVEDADFVIRSAATSIEEIGNHVYPPAIKKLAEHGIGTPDNDLGVAGKTARQVTMTDYEYYDVIVCMDNNNLRNIGRIIGKDSSNKVKLLLDYAGRLGEEVADPWYTGDFEATWQDGLEGCSALLKNLT